MQEKSEQKLKENTARQSFTEKEQRAERNTFQNLLTVSQTKRKTETEKQRCAWNAKKDGDG